MPAGSFTALLGVNGAGKSTLFNLITRLYDNVSGTIEVCGHDVRRDARHALAKLGVVFQSRALDGTLTVAQNFTYAGALYGMSPHDVRERGRELLSKAEKTGDYADYSRAVFAFEQAVELWPENTAAVDDSRNCTADTGQLWRLALPGVADGLDDRHTKQTE